MKDYYEILEVHPKASQEIIKKAYQTLAKKYHPDICHDEENSTKKMLELNEAYAILSSERSRAEYDSLYDRRNQPTLSEEPIRSKPDSNNSSSSDKEKLELQQFIAARNLAYTNNEKLFEKNDHLHLSRINGFGTTFLCQKNYDQISNSYITQYWVTLLFFPVLPIARYRVISRSYNKYLIISKIPPSNGSIFKEFLSMYKDNVIGSLVTLSVLLFIAFNAIFPEASTGAKSAAKNQLPPKAAATTTNNNTPQKNVKNEYVAGAVLGNNNGNGIITLDNSKNEAPVYVRIWSNGATPSPIRTFTIAAHGKFSAKNIDAGNYFIRYKFLYENSATSAGSESEPFTLTETKSQTGVNYEEMTLTLYKVSNGNTKTKNINANDV